jgi:hypothetical protein
MSPIEHEDCVGHEKDFDFYAARDRKPVRICISRSAHPQLAHSPALMFHLPSFHSTITAHLLCLAVCVQTSQSSADCDRKPVQTT